MIAVNRSTEANGQLPNLFENNCCLSIRIVYYKDMSCERNQGFSEMNTSAWGPDTGDEYSIGHSSSWAGPFKTVKQAKQEARFMWSPLKGSVLLEKNGFFWINDGIDANTGEEWESIPEGAVIL